MTLSFAQNLCYVLGYSARDFDPRYSSQPIQVPDYTEDDIVEIQKILDDLLFIDSELQNSRKDSMAMKVGEVAVDFNRNIQITKQEGSRLLRQLEQLSGVALRYDKYLGRSPNGLSATPLVVRNYC